jgi:aryl-alcohol dehydrogenase-like predicted oxidoreductase
MQTRQLGTTPPQLSVIGLGSMTWGQQNTLDEAFAQLDYAVEHGVNWVDVAEMYPVPANPDTSGRTEAYLGEWLKARGNRDKVFVATKVVGMAPNMTWIRDGQTCLDAKNIHAAVETSLRRLQTDVIDLYQVHWPDRETNCFGQLGYEYDPNERTIPLEETLAALSALVTAGKVRYIGMSNETPWGMMQYLNAAKHQGLERMASIQNPYSLVNRTFEVGLAEIAIKESCGLLAYSPLAFGRLTGKYLDGTSTPASRLNQFHQFTRYEGTTTQAACKAYVELAKQHGMSPTQMALAFVNTRPFVTSNIIGATTLQQLAENIASAEVTLPEELLAGIESIHATYSNPAP